MYNPVMAELAIKVHHDRLKKAESNAALAEAMRAPSAEPPPASRTFAVRDFIGALVIGFGLWIQGSRPKSSPTIG
jgi:hypothetical protein